jgi:hypothetical protein
MILPVHLYGCETWSLTLREENTLGDSGNRVLRRILRPKRSEVIERWRKLHNKELQNLYSQPDIIRMNKSRRVKWAEHVAPFGEKKNACRVLIGTPE